LPGPTPPTLIPTLARGLREWDWCLEKNQLKPAFRKV
jgi:hypothetical protein